MRTSFPVWNKDRSSWICFTTTGLARFVIMKGIQKVSFKIIRMRVHEQRSRTGTPNIYDNRPSAKLKSTIWTGPVDPKAIYFHWVSSSLNTFLTQHEMAERITSQFQVQSRISHCPYVQVSSSKTLKLTLLPTDGRSTLHDSCHHWSVWKSAIEVKLIYNLNALPVQSAATSRIRLG